VLIFLCIQTEKVNGYSNSEISEALAYSGCTFGLSNNTQQFTMQTLINSSLSIGLNYKIIDEGRSVDTIDKMDTPRGRAAYQHTLESWATAGVLNSKWKSLESTYEKGLLAGLKRWVGGANLGVSRRAAEATAGPKLTALCRVAEIAVTNKAKKAKMPLRQYIIKISGSYLPPLP
jgi:hypothetical protein